MSRLESNIVANFGGQAWAMLLSLAFLPVYIRILGVEAYGIIGLFLSLQAFVLILDMGLSATLSRELARRTHAVSAPEETRNLVRTLEYVYWPTGALIAVGVLFLSESIASGWLNPVAFTASQTAHAIALMGLAAAMQWPCALYAGGFRGLERQVALNALNASFATLRNVGAVAVLLLVSPTIEAFLWWQVLVACLQTATSGLLLWRLLPDGDPPKFRVKHLREIRGFALGMTAVVALSFVLIHSDRLILSKLLPLNEFGYYAIASTVAAALSSVVQPFFGALYPHFSALVSTGNQARLSELYHQSNQAIAVAIAPTACVLMYFSVDILRLWTGDSTLAIRSGPILSILVVGTALNGLMNLPYALQLAYGWTKLSIMQNIVAVFLIVPLIWVLGSRFGATGAAWAWLGLNLGYVTIGIPLMHRRLLKGEMARWYRSDIVPPVLAAVVTSTAARFLLPSLADGLVGLLQLSAVAFCCLVATSLSSSVVRSTYSRVWSKYRYQPR